MLFSYLIRGGLVRERISRAGGEGHLPRPQGRSAGLCRGRSCLQRGPGVCRGVHAEGADAPEGLLRLLAA